MISPSRTSEPSSDDRGARLAAAAASPAAVARHDRAAWLDAFTADGRVEDPVGIPPCQKGAFTLRPGSSTDDLTRFWNAFIARNDVRMELRRDLVVGAEVVRDLVIHTTFPGGAEVHIPAYVHYRLASEQGAWKVAQLLAHWDAREPGRQLARAGFRGRRAVLSTGFGLLRHFGLRGTRAYDEGCRSGIRSAGKPRVEQLVEALEARDSERVLAAFASASAPVELPVGRPAIPAEGLLTALGPYARLTVDRVIACGWYASAAFTLRREGTSHEGVVFFEFDPVLQRIARARFFWED